MTWLDTVIAANPLNITISHHYDSMQKSKIFLLILSMSYALGADPFTEGDNPFQSGWKPVTPISASGIHGDGTTFVAWGNQGFSISRDSGISWTLPILPSSGQVGVAGSVPLQIADAAVASGQVYIRSVDGAVRGGDGAPRNRTWGIGGISRMAVDGSGVLYAEQADGNKTIAVANGTVSGHAPGRLVGAFSASAVTWDGQRAYQFDGGATREVRVESVDGRPPLSTVPQSGPGTDVLRDSAGGTWTLQDGRFACTNHLKTQVNLLSFSACSIPKRNATAVGVLNSAQGTAIVYNAGGNFRNALKVLVADAPQGTVAVTQSQIDEHGNGRFRLLAATPNGIFMYRSE